ncbi:outer membrane protein assembly factor BamB family protein [Halorarum salinum]|uniref:PQQ-binding-like beta-propeller repeat protein n=1 Tax=Halorarum salinum TaxID=2743089 RepID=A0A7D5QIM3_9EURY|nr:PQQ-binding-like beta-propeller repeat protein [Halobaculum salinum]QLG63124.1 PQQ-binding-like beta-propeller repeat protein [Halobaculum salinum]
MRSRRGVLSGLATAGSLALAGCTGGGFSPGSDADTEWPAPGADAAATSYVADASAPRTPPSERWRASVGTPTGRPVVADGVVVVPSERGVTGVDLGTGEELWHRSGRAYGVCAHDGSAYATLRGEPAVVALTLDAGEEEWHVPGEASFGAAPLVAPGGDRVYAGDTAGAVRAYDPRDGAALWTFDAFTGVYSLAARRDALFVGTTGGETYQLHAPRSGVSPVWRRKLPGTVRSLSADDRTVYASTAGGGLFRLETDHAAGRTRWHAADAATTTGSLVAADRSVLAVDADRAVALASGTGDERWTRAFERSGATSAPAAAGDTLFVGVGGALRALALGGGAGVEGFRLDGERWRFEATVAAVAVADGAVLAACDDLDGEPAVVALE